MKQSIISRPLLFTIFVLLHLQLFETLSINRFHDRQLLKLDHSTNNNRGTFVQNIKENAVERPLHIGSFNVQTLGKKKFSDDRIMVNLEKVIHRYDLILITEVMTNDQKLIRRFLNDVNRFAPKGVSYNLTMNNDSITNEYCAFFYRPDKLIVRATDSYRDPSKFYRTPYFVLFESPTLRDMKQFGVIGFHVKPTQAVQEINALADVYDFMKMKYKLEDILLMGDFNADCTYVKEDDWPNIALWIRSEFTWPLGNHVDTTTNYKSCALDRFVYAGENMNTGIIMSSAKSLDLQDELYISLKEARALSDHKPIELKIRGKLSKTSEKYLTSENCFTVRDSRYRNVSDAEILKGAKRAFYTAQVKSPGAIIIRNETKDMDEMTVALKSLRSALPNVFTHEQVEAIMYKLNEGALEDKSSFADVQHSVFTIDFKVLKDQSSALICKTSTIN